jgi:hypothetical protein
MACSVSGRPEPAQLQTTAFESPGSTRDANTIEENPIMGVSNEGIDSGNPLNGSRSGWSGNKTLITGNIDTTLSVQADFSADPGPYTVQFDLSIPDQPQNGVVKNVAIKAEALIEWSVEGNTVTRRVDIGDGTTVSGVGQACRVVVTDQTDNAMGDTGFEYNVTVLIAKGTRPSVDQPPTLTPFKRTDPITLNLLLTIAPGGSLNVPIPLDAGVISANVTVIDTGSPPAPIPEQMVQVLQSIGGVVLRGCDPRAMTWIPVIPGVSALGIFNFTAGQTIMISVEFGIDG